MSRTFRNCKKKFRNNSILDHTYLRNPQTLSEVKQTESTIGEMEEYGFSPSNREKEIANYKKPSAYDDIINAGICENQSIILLNSLKIFFNKKTFIPKETTDEIAKNFFKNLSKIRLYWGMGKEFVNVEICGGRNTFEKLRENCLYYNDSYALDYYNETGFWILLTY